VFLRHSARYLYMFHRMLLFDIIFFCSNNTHIFQNHALKLKYQRSHVKVRPALQLRHSPCVCSMSATGSPLYITLMPKYSMH
jgi:hypothetical protein